MKIYKLIIALTLIAIIAPNIGCGSKDGINTNDVNELWENQILQIEALITGLEQAKEPQQITTAITTFTQNLEKNIPQFNDLFSKYPAFKEQMQKQKSGGGEPSQNTLEKNETMIKLIAVGLFTENIGKIQIQKYENNPNMKTTLQNLAKIQDTMYLDENLRNQTDVAIQYNNLVNGKMTGSPKVQHFFEKLRKAGITSMLKITIRNMVVIGKAIKNFIDDNGYAPKITDIDQLKSYQNFIPKYIEDEDSLPLEDAWGNYLYYEADGKNYRIGSAGSDGKFLGFEQKGSYTEMEGKDIILSDDRFIYFPQFKKNTGNTTQ